MLTVGVAALILKSIDSPLLMLCLVAKPSIPVESLGTFQLNTPGKQFSCVTTFEPEHTRAWGVTCTSRELPDSTPPTIARTP